MDPHGSPEGDAEPGQQHRTDAVPEHGVPSRPPPAPNKLLFDSALLQDEVLGLDVFMKQWGQAQPHLHVEHPEDGKFRWRDIGLSR